MITPVIRMIAAALADPTHGLTAKLAGLAVDTGTDVLPGPPTVINTVDNDNAVNPGSESALPLQDWPLVVIAAEEQFEVNVTGVVGKAFDVEHFPVLLAYVTGESMDRAQAYRDADYTFRALAFSLGYALLASNKGAARVRGKVTIVKHNSINWGPSDLKLKKGRVVGLMLLDLWIRVHP